MPTTPPTPAAIGALIEEFLRRLCGGQESRSLSAFADLDLSFSQVRMLMVLAYVDTALPINQIATHLNLTFASAGRNVERLLQENLLDRKESAHDRRVKLVQLTPLGRDLVSEHFECHRRMLADFTHRLSEADRVRMAAALVPVLDGGLLADVPPTLAGGARTATEPQRVRTHRTERQGPDRSGSEASR